MGRSSKVNTFTYRLWAGWRLAVVLLIHLAVLARCRADDVHVPERRPTAKAVQIDFVHGDRPRSVRGRIVVEGTNGLVLLEGEDGVLWQIERRQIRSREDLSSHFEPLSPDALAEELTSELPAGFRVHVTPHYVVLYNTSRAYAQWTSSLLERLHKAFTSYWTNRGIKIQEPEFPLPVLVFADRSAYDASSREDLPGGTGNIVGFYSLRSNRVNMFDLTGAEALHGSKGRRGSMREINHMLSQPAAVPLVSTIVHEATHQLAFNCGLANRFADIPLWQCEGMAVYFEAPDLTSTRGWRGMGRVNYPRLVRFQKNLPNWNDTSLKKLISTDDQFRDSETAVDAYADAWALNYFLIKYKSRDYADYLKSLSEKSPLIRDGPDTRVEEFREHFGDLKQLEQEFLKQMSRVK